MRIGIDGRELLGQRTGVGRYLAELCFEWQTSPRAADHHFLIYSHERADALAALGPPFLDPAANGRPRFSHRALAGTGGSGWEQVTLTAAASEDALDVFFAPAYSAPLRLHVPCAVTVHDVSFVAHPEWFPWREGMRRRWLTHHAVARAAAVITVSGFSREEVLRYYDVAPNKVRIIRSGIARDLVTDEDERSLDRPTDSPPNRDPLILYVGSLFNRRHLPTLLRAFEKVSRTVPEARLAIVGADRTYPREPLSAMVAATGVADRIALHSYVSEAELRALYRQARVFAFLSEYEGFGLTPLEAMSAGIPTIVGDTPVAREIYQDGAWFVGIRDIAATANAMTTLLVDPDQRAGYIRRAARALDELSWKRAAGETLDVLESIGHGTPMPGP